MLKQVGSERAPPDRVLVVDDDSDICELVANYLTSEGYVVDTVEDGQGLRQLIEAGENFSLIVLDLMLPGEDGLALSRYLSTSRAADVPILMLTARADDIDRIIGLESGADDYMAKPFVPRELSARIRAILRRMRTVPKELKPLQASRMVSFGDWTLDKMERCLIDNNGVVSPLLTAEYNLLVLFLENACKVLSRDRLIDKLIGDKEYSPFDRAIDLRVSRLRRCLKDSVRDSQYIRTVRNEGYLFVKQPQPA